MNRITPTTTPDGHRDVLDDRPIHAGAILELRRYARWIRVRYECDFDTREAWLELGDGSTLALNRAQMWLRWPGEPRSGWTGDGEKD